MVELTDEQKRKIASSISKMIEAEIDNLIYQEPKCDFEHIWNSAIASANDVVQSFQEDEYIGLNEDKLNEFVIKGDEDDEE